MCVFVKVAKKKKKKVFCVSLGKMLKKLMLMLKYSLKLLFGNDLIYVQYSAVLDMIQT